ncbi:thiol-disulfide oxidoreductase DCC family protein [Streptacidiphilus carbonis]|uniref:thiol-disulfide oxidoreductase DCC family protein n=1 Tax=Streptacidiphilus carbonis TaxID=105422 RepID=UPI0007C81251|nr:DCC1-like thiol-disulfide oxidoreductase family protein [Streptacidiphilus carbonis]
MPATTAAPGDRGTSDAPVLRLTVLFDPGCMLCRHVKGWLEKQRKLVPMEFVPAGSRQARDRYPALDHDRTLREITVIGDSGQVYEGPAAWVVCLWALHAYRVMSHRFSTPAGAPLAKGMVLAAAKWRERAGSQFRSPSPVPDRPTAQGRAGRSGAAAVPMGEWVWTGRSWQSAAAVQAAEADREAAPECGDTCAPPGG